MNAIRMDYGEMERVAGVFEQKAGEIDAVLSALRGRITQLNASWDGVAEQAFYQEWVSCDRKLSDTPRMLREIAVTLRRIAQEIRQAEEQMRAKMSQLIQSDNR